MATTADDVRDLVGASPSDNDELTKCLALAIVWVDKYLEDRMTDDDGEKVTVPPVVYDEAVLLVAADEFSRRHAPNGVLNQQYAAEDGVQAVPVRISRDPLSAAYAPLAPWMDVVVGSA